MQETQLQKLRQDDEGIEELINLQFWETPMTNTGRYDKQEGGTSASVTVGQVK